MCVHRIRYIVQLKKNPQISFWREFRIVFRLQIWASAVKPCQPIEFPLWNKLVVLPAFHRKLKKNESDVCLSYILIYYQDIRALIRDGYPLSVAQKIYQPHGTVYTKFTALKIFYRQSKSDTFFFVFPKKFRFSCFCFFCYFRVVYFFFF